MKYNVSITRTAHQCKTFTVEADDEKAAEHKAKEMAYDTVWDSSHAADYSTDYVTEDTLP
jgi:hypothetical protein